MKKTKTKIASALLTAVMAVSAYATPCFAAENRLMVDRAGRTLDGKNRTGQTWAVEQDSFIKIILFGRYSACGRYGDCNGDGVVSAVDATLIARYCVSPNTYGQEVLGYEEPDDGKYDYYFYMDVNSDGTINAADGTLVLRYSLENR